MSADPIDNGQETDQFLLSVALKNAAREIPLGEPGECLCCETWYARTVNGYCAKCRDEFKLG